MSKQSIESLQNCDGKQVLFTFVTNNELKSLELSDTKFNIHPRHKYVDHRVTRFYFFLISCYYLL